MSDWLLLGVFTIELMFIALIWSYMIKRRPFKGGQLPIAISTALVLPLMMLTSLEDLADKLGWSPVALSFILIFYAGQVGWRRANEHNAEKRPRT